jgi:hypothetical protein
MHDIALDFLKQTVSIVYSNSVSGFVPLLIVGDHHGNFKLFKTLFRKRYADVPARMDVQTKCTSAKDSYLVCLIIHAIASTEHWLAEIIALILSSLVIHDNNGFTPRECVQRLLYRIKGEISSQCDVLYLSGKPSRVFVHSIHFGMCMVLDKASVNH